MSTPIPAPTAQEFRPIPGFEGLYEVSRDGTVRRSTSGGGWPGKPGAWPTGRKVRPYPHENQAVYHLWRGGKEIVLTTAQLLSKTFGVPRDELVDYAKGSRNPAAKLTEADIPEIREMYRREIPTEEIGRLFGVSGRTIRDIRAGKIWRHIQ